MARPQGRCIFCGGTDLSKEHIWADWLKPHLPRLSESYNAAVELIHPNLISEISLKKRPGDPRRRRVRCVCLACNTGWMSRLQEQAKPTILSVMGADASILNRRTQTLLSTWSAMLSMTAEFTHREHVAISPRERSWLMINRKPPSHWRIWAAYFSDELCEIDYEHSSLEFVEKNAPQTADESVITSNTQTTTFRVGCALIHLMSASVPLGQREIRRWKWRPAIATKLVRIWPIASPLVRWPLDARLARVEARFVANGFIDWHIGLGRSA